MKNKLLTLTEFIQQHYKWFKIDQQSHDLIKLLGHYAMREQKQFESEEWIIKIDDIEVQTEVFIEKGILLVGGVGTGKTEMFRIFKQYQEYLRSPYAYRMDVVWRFADRFRQDGSEAMRVITTGNYYFDELCLTDENGEPTKERSQHFGNKVLMGEEIIRMRYELFKRGGWYTHFSTNESPKKLKAIYGPRAFSRLLEMCNVIPLEGRDRRLNRRPTFLQNDVLGETFQAPTYSQEELDKEIKGMLDAKLGTFLATESTQQFNATDYNQLQMLGIAVCSEEELKGRLVEEAKKVRKKNITNPTSVKNWKYVWQMHLEDKFDTDEQREIIVVAKWLAVIELAHEVKAKGKTSFFE